jgi:chaperone modulatory protein CbpM
MTYHLSETEVIAAIPGLTQTRLVAFIAAEVVIPLHTESGPAFRHIDIARMQLLCELTDDLDETALGIIITLIDQLHAARSDLRALARALESEPAEVRARVGAALMRAQG